MDKPTPISPKAEFLSYFSMHRLEMLRILAAIEHGELTIIVKDKQPIRLMKPVESILIKPESRREPADR